MELRSITVETLAAFAQALRAEERCTETIKQYTRSVRQFAAWLAPETVRGGPFASREPNLLRKVGEDRLLPDDFSHEQSMVLETGRGLVVLNSCCHGGVVNIVKGVLDQFPGQRGIYVSSGSACHKGKPSHVYAALKLPKPQLDGILRISFSYDTAREDVDALVQGLKEAQAQLFTSLS